MLYDDELLPMTDLMLSDKSSANQAIPLKCKWNFVLSDIWIPADILPNRKTKNDCHLESMIYHSLGGDAVRRSKSFSVYNNSDSETADEEIFISDNEDEFLLSFGNDDEDVDCSFPTTHNTVNNSVKATESLEDTIKYSSTNSSACSLHDVDSEYSDNAENALSKEVCNIELDAFQTSSGERPNLGLPTVSEAGFRIINKKQLNCEKADGLGRAASPKKYEIKKAKSQWKKSQKPMPLENFLQNDDQEFKLYEPERDHFYENVIRSNYHSNFYELSDFPSLSKACSSFETETANAITKDHEPSIKNIVDLLSEQTMSKEKICSSVDSLQDVIEENMGNNNARIVIENIPLGVPEKDIFDIVLGYGELKGFSLKQAGDFLTAELELDLISDLDWIIECLNGSQPFGASSEMLKCYKKEDL